jgi:hypothetical protein
MVTLTAEDRFKYNLLAERINEANALVTAACRAADGFRPWEVRGELELAVAALMSGRLDKAERHCEEAERLFLAECRGLRERRSFPYKRLEASLRQIWGTPIVREAVKEPRSRSERMNVGFVGWTNELQAAWDALEDFDYDRAERLSVKAERKVRRCSSGPSAPRAVLKPRPTDDNAAGHHALTRIVRPGLVRLGVWLADLLAMEGCREAD